MPKSPCRMLIYGARVCAVPGWTAAQACLGFVLSHPDVHSAAFATADLRHLHENAGASGRDLPVEVIRRIVAAHG